MIVTMRRLGMLALLPGMAACSRATSASQPAPLLRDPIDRVLAPRVTPAFRSEVLVLGTTHLGAQRDRLTPAHLESLLSRLEAFAPTRIAIEALTPDELALLAERETHEPAAAELLEMFGRAMVTAGRTMQQVLGVDRVTAAQRARALLAHDGRAPTDDERLSAVAYLVAAYDFNSAVLQWSWLPATVRDRVESIPPDVHGMLQRRLESANEIVTVALPLARRLGVQQLDPIDSQYDGIRTLSLPRDALVALLSDSARGRMQDQEKQRHADAIREAAFTAGDLLPMYLYINSDAYQAGDLTQWNWLFEQRHGGLDRFRYAMWEVRNLRQATHIIDVAASTRPERVLVIVGSSHKAALDRLLATQLSVRLVQLEQVAAPAGALPEE